MLNFNLQTSDFLNQKPKFKMEDFIFRLKKLEKVCNKEKLDGILFINGLDSKDNNEYTKLNNWLFLGNNGVQIEENEYLDEIFKEVLFLIRKDGTLCIFALQDFMNEFKGFIISVPKVECFVPTEQQMNDSDEVELLKINFFYKIMQGVQKVGMLLGKKDHQNIKNIEKWPLIQMYGHSELGMGFFSLNHQAVDLTARINRIYENHDQYSLNFLIFENANRIKSCFTSSCNQISDCKIIKRANIKQNQLNEIFTNVYEMSKLSKFIRPTINLPPPQILFGVNTNSNQDSKEDAQFHNSGIGQNKPAIHQTLEYVDNYTKVRVGRTYFLVKNTKLDFDFEDVFDDDNYDQLSYKLQLKRNENFRDEDQIINLYISMIVGFYDAMISFTKNYKLMTEEYIFKAVAQRINKVYEFYHEKAFQKNQLQIDLKCYNSFGEETKIDFKEAISFKLTPYIYVLRLQLKQIPSLIEENTNIGAILFCESFILQEACYLLITKEVPYLDFWNISSYSDEKLASLNKQLVIDELGKKLSDQCNNLELFLPHLHLPAYNIECPMLICQITLFEKGLKLHNNRLGSFLIQFKDINNMMILIKTKKPFIIAYMNQNNVALNSIKINIFCIEFSGSAQVHIFNKMKSIMEKLDIQSQYIEEPPEFFYTNSLLKSKLLDSIFDKTQESKLIAKSQIQDKRFFLSFIQSKQLVILNKLKDIKMSYFQQIYEQKNKKDTTLKDQQLRVIIVNGSYSSGKTRFAEHMINLQSSSQQRLHLIRANVEDLLKIKDEKQFLAFVINKIQELKHEINFSQSIILLVQPHHINTRNLIEILELQQETLRITCVVTKININNINENKNQQIAEKIIVNASQGYSQYVLLDSYGNQEKDIDFINKMIQKSLTNQRIYRIMNNILSESLVNDILNCDDFETEESQLQRLKFSFLFDYPLNTKNQFRFIPFTLPIVQSQLENSFFKKIFQQKNGFLNFSGDDSKVRFEEEQIKKSKDQLALEIFNLKKKISETQIQLSESTPHLKYIKAIVRFDEKLEEGLFELTITSNYIIQRQIKGIRTFVEYDKNDKNQVTSIKYENFEKKNEIGFFIYGENLDVQMILDQLILLTKPKQALIPFKTKEHISRDELKEIQFQKRSWGLDDEYFYDGCNYRDWFGNFFENHPKLDAIIEAHLNEVNAQIEQENSKIREHWKEIDRVFDLQ